MPRINHYSCLLSAKRSRLKSKSCLIGHKSAKKLTTITRIYHHLITKAKIVYANCKLYSRTKLSLSCSLKQIQLRNNSLQWLHASQLNSIGFQEDCWQSTIQTQKLPSLTWEFAWLKRFAFSIFASSRWRAGRIRWMRCLSSSPTWAWYSWRTWTRTITNCKLSLNSCW